MQDTSHDALRTLAEAISRGAPVGELMAERPGKVTVRVRVATGAVVMKLWNLNDRRSRIRWLLGRSKGRCEWRTLARLQSAGIAAPQPIAFFRLRGRGVRHHEALVIEDLSPCVSLQTHLHGRTKQYDPDEVEKVNHEVIRITKAMADAGVYDNDHRVANFVVSRDGSIYRVDFENARRLRPGRRRDRALGVMLGALISSYAWIVRFEPSLTPPFVEALLKAVRPGERSLRHARQAAAKDLQRRPGNSNRILPADLGW